MDKKEKAVQKALGTLDHFKCIKCSKVSYKNSLAVPIYEIIHTIGGSSFRECMGVTYKCSCGSEELEYVE